MLLNKYDHHHFQLGPYNCYLWDGNGTFGHLALSVGTPTSTIFKKTYENNTVCLDDVKRDAANAVVEDFRSWLCEAERLCNS